MFTGNVAQLIDLLISQYLPVFCLVTIPVWALLASRKHLARSRPLHDGSVYFVAIGALALTLVMIRPQLATLALCLPLMWFCYAALAVLELLWVLFLCEGLYQLVVFHTSKRKVPEERETPYCRPRYHRR